jgi:hypothetical protein
VWTQLVQQKETIAKIAGELAAKIEQGQMAQSNLIITSNKFEEESNNANVTKHV